jgi:hypothetical protein
MTSHLDHPPSRCKHLERSQLRLRANSGLQPATRRLLLLPQVHSTSHATMAPCSWPAHYQEPWLHPAHYQLLASNSMCTTQTLMPHLCRYHSSTSHPPKLPTFANNPLQRTSMGACQLHMCDIHAAEAAAKPSWACRELPLPRRPSRYPNPVPPPPPACSNRHRRCCQALAQVVLHEARRPAWGA